MTGDFDLHGYFKKNYLTESLHESEGKMSKQEVLDAIKNNEGNKFIIPTKAASDPNFAEHKLFPGKKGALDTIENLDVDSFKIKTVTIPYIEVATDDKTDAGIANKLSSGEYGSLD